MTPWFDRTRELALLLTRWPSVSDSPEEARFAEHLHGYLSAWPYFQQHPQHLWTSPVPHTAARNLYALVEGCSERTIVLSGHYDTVSLEPYGALHTLACDPEALKAALIAELQARERGPAEALALDDLSSGDFLPGRGLLDMKSGLAAGLAVLERYAQLPLAQRPYQLLFVTSPDEEGLSRGARSVVQDLPTVAQRHGLQPIFGINLDATNDTGDGQDGQALYLGTVGKLLVTALVLGRPTHASYPFDGSSAALLAAEFIRQLEGHPDWHDEAHGQAVPPPTCLELREDKTHYDVTTPGQFWCAFNVLTHRLTPEQVLERVQQAAERALAQALATFAGYAQSWGSPSAAGLQAQRGRVLTIGQLRELALARVGAEAVQSLVDDTPAYPHPLRASQRIVQQLGAWAGLEGPAIVLGFGGVHYPHTHLADGAPAQLEPLQTLLEEFNQGNPHPVRLRPYFAGISDMSFLGYAPSQVSGESVALHTAHPAHLTHLPAEALAFPSVNLGPWGRDYHQKLERVYQPYAFETLPKLLWSLVKDKKVNL